MSYYNNNTVPDHYTDGILRGGSYESNYTTRRAVPAPLTVTFVTKNLTATNATVKVRVTLEENLPAGHDIYIALWEDKVVVGGTYGSTAVRVLERDLATTTLTITNANQSQEFEHVFTVQAGWVAGNLGVTAWVQGPNTDREVHNATAAKFLEAAVAPASLGRVKALFN